MKDEPDSSSPSPVVEVEATGDVAIEGQVDVRQESGFYEAYAGFARTLRAWLIAYGVGGPVIFLTNDAAGRALAEAGVARDIAHLFLAGVALQVAGAVLYKSAMWYLYIGELQAAFRNSRRYRVADWISERHFIELLFDVGSMTLFALATLGVLDVLTR